MDFILYLFLLILASDFHLNPGPSQYCKALYINIRGLKVNLKDVAVASPNYDIIFCTETRF